MTAPKISKYSLSELKNTTDDALPNYLTSLQFTQSHFLTDIRLALGYTAVTIAGLLFYFDWKHGWDATKAATLWTVLAYFTINGALTVWIWGVEGGKVFVGKKDGVVLSVASSVTKHTPIYNVIVRYKTPSGKEETKKLSAPFTRWFDADGCFVAKPFQNWLASEIKVVGEADPKNKGGKMGSEGVQVVEAVVVEQSETPRKGGSREETPASTRSRKGKK